MIRINKLLEMLQQTPGDNFLQHALALEYVKAGDDEKAQQTFENLLHAQPDYVGSYYHLAKLFERAGDEQKAVEVYEKGMAVAKGQGDQHAFSELKSALEFLIY